jgi:hypothetical protein
MDAGDNHPGQSRRIDERRKTLFIHDADYCHDRDEVDWSGLSLEEQLDLLVK